MTDDSNKRPDRKNEAKSLPTVFALVALVVVIVSYVFAWIVVCNLDSWEKRGQFGDMFGALNTVFSGLAFGGVLYAISLQRRELELQREARACQAK